MFPIPSLTATCAAAGLELNLFIGEILFGLGEIIGELSGYAIGAYLLFSLLIPNPVFDFVGISAGALRYPIKRFLLIVWVGKIAKGIIYAHTCYWIVQWVRWLD